MVLAATLEGPGGGAKYVLNGPYMFNKSSNLSSKKLVTKLQYMCRQAFSYNQMKEEHAKKDGNRGHLFSYVLHENNNQ